VELKGTGHLLVNVDDVNLLDENMNALSRTRAPLGTCREDSRENTKYQLMYGHQSPGDNRSLNLLPRCSHTWKLAPASEHRAEFPQFLNLGHSVGLL
jgi:hypothetical protein